MSEATVPEFDLIEARWQRLKQLRWTGNTFAAMVPTLIREGYLPEHVAHENQPIKAKGNRTDRRNKEVCARCEHTIGEQWRRNHARLRDDEAGYDEAKWQWFADQQWIIEQARSDYRQRVVIVTTKTKRVEPIEGTVWPVIVKLENGEREERLYPAEAISGIANVTEVSERVEHRIYPQLLEIMSEVRDKIARVSGVPIEEVGDPDRDHGSKERMRGIRVTLPAGWTPGGRPDGNGPPVN